MKWRGVIWVVENRHTIEPMESADTRKDIRESRKRFNAADFRIMRYLRAPWYRGRKA